MAAVPILGVRDVRATVDWFVDVLGFDVVSVFAPPIDEGAVYAIVHRGDMSFHLQIRRGEIESRVREGIESDAYVYVTDADALHEEFVASGATILRGIQDEEYGLRDFCVETPDGHRLVFGSPLDVAPG